MLRQDERLIIYRRGFGPGPVWRQNPATDEAQTGRNREDTMTTITIHADEYSDIHPKFDGETYTIDLDRAFGGYVAGDLICFVSPWIDMPLTLEIAIRATGELVFRNWAFDGRGNAYLHTREISVEDAAKDTRAFSPTGFTPTAAQIDTVSGLFSRRITFEGLRLSPGGTLQKVCPIDLAAEQATVGHQIYLA